MTRTEFSALVVLLAASAAAGAEEALDEEFLAFLAEEAVAVEQAGATAPELVAWLNEWWNPAATSADVRAEETK